MNAVVFSAFLSFGSVFLLINCVKAEQKDDIGSVLIPFANIFPQFMPQEGDGFERVAKSPVQAMVRFGKRSGNSQEDNALAEIPSSRMPSLVHFGKRDRMPSLVHFGKRDRMPSLVRFGKRSTDASIVADDDMWAVEKRSEGNEGPEKRETSERYPSLVRFGKRDSSYPSLVRFGRSGSYPSMVRFGKRSGSYPSLVRFGKRSGSYPSLVRFGKRAGSYPSLVRFGKRDSSYPSLVRFGRSGSYPTLVRFGKRSRVPMNRDSIGSVVEGEHMQRLNSFRY